MKTTLHHSVVFSPRAHSSCLLLLSLLVVFTLTSSVYALYRNDELGILNGFTTGGNQGDLKIDYTYVKPGSSDDYSLKFQWNNTDAELQYWRASTRIPKTADITQYDTISYDIYVYSRVGDVILNIYLADLTGARWICNGNGNGAVPISNYPLNQWTHVETNRNAMQVWITQPGEWSSIKSVSIQPSGGTSGLFFIDNLKLKNSQTGATLDLVGAFDDGYATNTRSMAVPPPIGASLFPYGIDILYPAAMRSTPQSLATTIGTSVGIPLIGCEKEMNALMNDLNLPINGNIKTLHYSQMNTGYFGFLSRRQLWDTAKTSSGTVFTLNSTAMDDSSLIDPGHTASVSGTGAYLAGKDKIDQLAKAGIPTWQVVDYVFPWFPDYGVWGHGALMAQAFQQDLAGTDQGITILDNGVPTTMKFADYFYKFNRFLPSPAHFGLSAWSAFVPPNTGNESNYAAKHTLFLFLRSYEWVKLADSLGQYHKTKGGTGLWVIPNPESAYGSSDYATLIRSKGVNNLLLECFGKPGHLSETAYACGPYLREQATRGGNRLSVLLETGSGGNSSGYWDWLLNYITTYELTAAYKADNFQNDFLTQRNNNTYANMSSGFNPEDFDNFRDSVSKGKAFAQARNDGAVRPAAQILCLGDRATGKLSAGLFNTINDKYSLARSLSRAHYVFDYRDACVKNQTELGSVLNNYKMVVYSPLQGAYDSTNNDFSQLNNWLNGAAGRVLVTHSFVPTRSTKQFWGMNINSSALGGYRDFPGGTSEYDTSAKLGLGVIRPNANTAAGTVVTVQSAVGSWANVFPAGTQFILTAPLTTTTAGTTLVNTDKGPLVTQATVGTSKVIYLHFNSQDPAEAYGLSMNIRAMQVVASDLCGISPICFADNSTIVQKYNVTGGHVVTFWDDATLNNWPYNFTIGMGPRLNWYQAGVNKTIKLIVPNTNPYRVLDFWSGLDPFTVTPTLENGVATITFTLQNGAAKLSYVGQGQQFENTMANAYLMYNSMAGTDKLNFFR